jgi:plasmid stabilization system protein ParE
MSWKIDYHKEAQKEFDEAYDHYEEQKEGLGEDFAKCVQDQIDYLKMNPKIHAKVYKEARRAVVKRFPYCIYYVIEKDRVIIASVFFTGQDPSKWQSRI